MSFDLLSSRVVSGFPVSVGTGLALESIFTKQIPSIDNDRVIPQKVNILDYEYFFVNIATLFRNLMGSLTKEDSARVFPRELSQVLLQEMELIQELVSTESLNRTKTYFYVNQYKNAHSHLKYVLLKVDNTDRQKIFKHLQNESINLVLKEVKDNDFVKVFDDEIKPPTKGKALLLTHNAYDLLSSKNFQELHLIESHTGILKKKQDWNTKYHEGKSLLNIPFNKVFIKVFGDSEIYKPMDIKLRRSVIELAEKQRWTALTTKDKIRHDINEYLANPFFKEVLLYLF